MFIQRVREPLGQITLAGRPWRLRGTPKGVQLNMEIARHARICICTNAQLVKIKPDCTLLSRQTEGSLNVSVKKLSTLEVYSILINKPKL